MHIDLLQPEDVTLAAKLSATEGWNQSEDDWHRMLALSPQGCFVARAGAQFIGSVTTISYGSRLSWIGMMVVRADHRRRGLGGLLMKKAINHLHDCGVQRVMLDATPAGRPLFATLGFRDCGALERWQGVARRSAPDSGEAASLDHLVAIDGEAYGAPREHLLRALYADRVSPVSVVEDAGQLHALALARKGRMATYIGPVIADSTHAAQAVLQQAMDRLDGQAVQLDRTLQGYLAADYLLAAGFTPQRTLTRMYLGPFDTHEATSPLICAPAGPEYG